MSLDKVFPFSCLNLRYPCLSPLLLGLFSFCLPHCSLLSFYSVEIILSPTSILMWIFFSEMLFLFLYLLKFGSNSLQWSLLFLFLLYTWGFRNRNCLLSAVHCWFQVIIQLLFLPPLEVIIFAQVASPKHKTNMWDF